MWLIVKIYEQITYKQNRDYAFDLKDSVANKGQSRHSMLQQVLQLVFAWKICNMNDTVRQMSEVDFIKTCLEKKQLWCRFLLHHKSMWVLSKFNFIHYKQINSSQFTNQKCWALHHCVCMHDFGKMHQFVHTFIDSLNFNLHTAIIDIDDWFLSYHVDQNNKNIMLKFRLLSFSVMLCLAILVFSWFI